MTRRGEGVDHDGNPIEDFSGGEYEDDLDETELETEHGQSQLSAKPERIKFSDNFEDLRMLGVQLRDAFNDWWGPIYNDPLRWGIVKSTIIFVIGIYATHKLQVIVENYER